MSGKIFDMGFDSFESREELKNSLAYNLINGLYKHNADFLLCDFSIGNKKYSARKLLAMSLALSRRLSAYKQNKRAGIVIPPCKDALIINYACVFAGIVPVNLNFTLGRVAAESCVETAKITTMFCASYAYDKIAKANPSFPWAETIVYVDSMLAEIPESEITEINEIISKGTDFVMESFGIRKEALAESEGTLVFTSGSEGAPKAAILTERNLVANCLQTNLVRIFEKDDILLANLPIFHSFGLLFEVWYMAMFGQKTVTLISPLDVKNNIRAVREMKASAIIGSPTFFRAYLKHASPEDMQTLRVAIAGAEKTPEGFHEMWNEKFGDTYREGYGLTEASPVVGVNLPERDMGFFTTGSRRGSIGKLFPGMQAKILDADTFEELSFGAQGLLAMKGANIFAGYLDNPKATSETLRDGWLVTGDLSRIDADGFLYIDGRLSRFSKIGGEMVPHATVEAALNKELGLVSDMPLIAISSRLDEAKGEALVLLSATDITLAQAKDALRKAGVSNLWQPKYLVKVPEIPLLPSGKLNLKRLSRLARA